jgi:hypothetical protein
METAMKSSIFLDITPRSPLKFSDVSEEPPPSSDTKNKPNKKLA